MNLRWLWGNYALKEHELDGRTAWELSTRAHKKHMPRSTFVLWTIFALIVPVVLVFKFVLPLVLGWLGMTGQNMPYVVGIAVVLVVFWVWAAWVYKHLYAKPMRRAICETGRALCVECGYDLTGLDGDIKVCPECGSSRKATEARTAASG